MATEKNFNDTNPAPSAGFVNVQWQYDLTTAGIDPDTGQSYYDVSAQVPIGGGAIWAEEVPTGTLNGINKTFTLLHTPILGSLDLLVNIPQIEGTDFTISTATITFTKAPKARDAGWFLAKYQYL